MNQLCKWNFSGNLMWKYKEIQERKKRKNKKYKISIEYSVCAAICEW